MPVTQILIATAGQTSGGSPPPPPPQGDFAYTGDNDSWVALGGFYLPNSFPTTEPSKTAHTYADGTTGYVRNFTGTECLVSPNLGVGGVWQSNTITVDLWFYPTANSVQLLGEYNSNSLNTYRYTVLEIDSTNHVKARYYNGTPLTSVNTVQLNVWNHIWFTEDGQGGHNFTLNGVPTNGNPVYTRQGPGSTSEYFAVGDSCSTNMGNTGRFQGKIGWLNIHDYYVSSTFASSYTKFRAPINTGTSLGTSWSIELVADFHPTTYWASIWGNENNSNSTGHLAYLTGPSVLNVGSWIGEETYNLSFDIEETAHWVFTHTDGAGISVYRNTTLLSKFSGVYSQPTPASNTLLIGSRHGNSGSGTTDPCPGNYYYYNTTNTVMDQSAVTASYNSLKSTYNLP